MALKRKGVCGISWRGVGRIYIYVASDSNYMYLPPLELRHIVTRSALHIIVTRNA